MSTKLNWQAMTARERDHLIAVMVCGWEYFEDAKSNSRCIASEDHKHNWFNPSDGCCYAGPNYFTTCPKAAMEVIEAMEKKGYAFLLNRDVGGQWSATFYRHLPEQNEHEAEANTMEEAVSRCALLAVGVEVG